MRMLLSKDSLKLQVMNCISINIHNLVNTM